MVNGMFWRTLITSASLSLFAALTAYPLVNSGNPGGNRSAPTGENGEPTDPGFANVGRMANPGGVYLGNGWVLTARHVGTQAIILTGGKTYKWDGVNAYSFPNAELRLFKLAEMPDLPTLKISSKTQDKGQFLVMIGTGGDSQDHLTYWRVDQSANPWVWTEVPERRLGNAAGVIAAPEDIKSWGTNRVSAVLPNPSLGELIVTDFSENPVERTPFEAQAITHDSGGAVFAQTADGGWELTGIMVTVAQLFPGQPEVVQKGNRQVIQSGVFGNVTLSVNLAPYRDKILEVTGLGDQ